jgi:hypothetical protein
MKRKQLAAALVGVIVASLGLLWFLQGAGILRLCPVLCFLDCECVSSGSQFWEATGAIVLIVGLTMIALSLRHVSTR